MAADLEEQLCGRIATLNCAYVRPDLKNDISEIDLRHIYHRQPAATAKEGMCPLGGRIVAVGWRRIDRIFQLAMSDKWHSDRVRIHYHMDKRIQAIFYQLVEDQLVPSLLVP